ncbi:MAG: hypothetical protein HFH03_01330 [Dorea sp.]|nr:hypothetical protein [Dorea sp.]
MKKITKSFIAVMCALSLSILSGSFTSHAVNVTKDYGVYRGVVSLTRYTSNGVKMVKNGKAVKCTLVPKYQLVYTYIPSSKSVTLASTKKSYTLKSRGQRIELGEPKGYMVNVSIPGFK